MKPLCNNRRNVFTCSILLILMGIGSSGFADLSRTLPLVRTDGTSVGLSQGVALPRGTVSLSMKDGKQTFMVDAYNLDGPFTKGLAVYLGTAPQITNGILQYVDV